MGTTYPSDLTDAEWACVQRSLPPLPARGRPRTHPLRRILDASFYVLRTGCAWRYLPSNVPPWQAVFYHFRRLRLQGTWHLLYSALHRAERERVGRHPDPSAAIMDSQSVKTVEESAHIRGYDGHKCIKIVCSQMTKTHVLAGWSGRNDLPDLDIIVRDDHPIDEQLDELALLLEGGVLETALKPLTNGFNRLRQTCEVPLPLRSGL